MFGAEFVQSSFARPTLSTEKTQESLHPLKKGIEVLKMEKSHFCLLKVVIGKH